MTNNDSMTSTMTGPKRKPVFPTILYNILQDADEHGFDDVVSWNKDGESFKIHDRTRFLKQILPKYSIRSSHHKSIVRQLNLWGFSCIHGGSKAPNRGSYHHKYFLRGRADLCNMICRSSTAKVAIISPAVRRNGILIKDKSKSNANVDDNTKDHVDASPINAIQRENSSASCSAAVHHDDDDDKNDKYHALIRSKLKQAGNDSSKDCIANALDEMMGTPLLDEIVRDDMQCSEGTSLDCAEHQQKRSGCVQMTSTTQEWEDGVSFPWLSEDEIGYDRNCHDIHHDDCDRDLFLDNELQSFVSVSSQSSVSSLGDEPSHTDANTTEEFMMMQTPIPLATVMYDDFMRQIDGISILNPEFEPPTFVRRLRGGCLC